MRAKYPLAGTWILLAALSLAGLGHASVVRPYTDVELATLAESVLVGTVADIASRSSAGGQSIETEIAIRVVLPIKGCRQGDVIRLTMPGGTVGTMTQWVSGVPAFRIGEDALLHVERLRSGELGVLGWRRGKSAVTSGRIAASGAPLAEAVDSIRGLVGAKAVPISTIDLDAASHLFPDSPAVAPSIANISPASASGNTGTVITIAGTDFGSSQGTVTFPWAGTSNQADIVSWSSTQIKCRVPQAESGAVTVRTSGAAASNPYSYQITFCALDFKLPESAMPDKFTCHSAGTPDATNEFAEIEAAFSNWTGTPNTLIDALGLPNVGTPPLNYDANQVIGWVESGWAFPSGVIAVCMNWYLGAEIAHHDIAFNGEYYTWSDSAAPGQIDIQSVATHELGHWWGLDDMYGWEDRDKTMYGVTYYGSATKRSLDAADIEGIQTLYPGAGPSPEPPVYDWVSDPAFGGAGTSPAKGLADTTEFTFAVKITDPNGTVPARMDVKIRRIEDRRKWRVKRVLKLRPVSGDWATGMICEAKVKLPNGVYQYRFSGKDVDGMRAIGDGTKWRRGPKMNDAPQLWCTKLTGRTDDYLHPNSGVSPGTNFKFAVQYLDSEGNRPLVNRVHIQRKTPADGWEDITTGDMTAAGGTPKTGMYFTWASTLDVGEYRHRFEFADMDGPATGASRVSGDATTWQPGPLVEPGDGSASDDAFIASLSAIPTAQGAEAIFSLTGDADVDARVLNIAGRPIRVIQADAPHEAGLNRVIWSARDDSGLAVPSGTYIVELTARGADGHVDRAIAQVHIRR